MLEIIETYTQKGMSAFVSGLPAGHAYTIWEDDQGHYISKSKPASKNGIRYYQHQSYNDSIAHGIRWAKSKKK